MKKIISFTPFLILIIIMSIGFFAVSRAGKQQPIDAQLSTNNSAPLPRFYFDNLIEGGEKLSIDDFFGDEIGDEINDDNKEINKIALINIFASWCSTCKAEHHYLLELAQNKSINIYGIAWHDINQNTKDYLTKNGNPYVKVGVDKRGASANLFGIKAVPETFVISKGKIIYHYSGNIDQAFLDYIDSITK